MRRPKAYTDAHRAADAHAPALARGLVSALRSIATERVTHTALAEGYTGGTVSHAVHAIDWNGLEDDLLHAIQPLLIATIARTSHTLAPTVRKALNPDITAALSYGFDITNPRAVTWAQKYAANLALNLSAEAHQAVRSMVVTMFEQGVPPQAAARRIRAMIGLDRRYAAAVLKYQEGLVAKGTVPQNVVTDLVDQYSSRLLQQRAETIARTESLRAAVKGQQLLWQSQIDRGTLDTNRVRQAVVVTPDDRLCPVCAAIPGAESVFGGGSPNNQPPVGGLFYVPATGQYVDGPPFHVCCRCDLVLLFANPDGTFPEPKSLFAEVLAYAGADGPPAARVLQPRVPLRYR